MYKNNEANNESSFKEMWNKRKRNKLFWLALASAIYLLASQLGLNIFPENFMDIVNSVLLIFTILGVVIDPTTDGITDKPKTIEK